MTNFNFTDCGHFKLAEVKGKNSKKNAFQYTISVSTAAKKKLL